MKVSKVSFKRISFVREYGIPWTHFKTISYNILPSDCHVRGDRHRAIVSKVKPCIVVSAREHFIIPLGMYRVSSECATGPRYFRVDCRIYVYDGCRIVVARAIYGYRQESLVDLLRKDTRRTKAKSTRRLCIKFTVDTCTTSFPLLDSSCVSRITGVIRGLAFIKYRYTTNVARHSEVSQCVSYARTYVINAKRIAGTWNDIEIYFSKTILLLH